MVKTLTEKKREDIIQAAKDEFRDNGFSATSMDRIAETAKVSKRTVYNHFESKEVLFGAIAENLCTVFSRVSDYPYDPAIPVRTQVEAIAGQQMDMLCSERFLRTFKLIMTETLSSPSLTQSTVDNFQETNIGMVKWVTEASQDGKLKAVDPVFAAKQFFALLEVFTSWPYLFGKPEKYNHKDILQSAVDMFLNHYEVRP